MMFPLVIIPTFIAKTVAYQRYRKSIMATAKERSRENNASLTSLPPSSTTGSLRYFVSSNNLTSDNKN